MRNDEFANAQKPESMIIRKPVTDPDIGTTEEVCTAGEAPAQQLSPYAGREKIEAEVIDLLHKHSASLSRYAIMMTRDRSIAQDGIQEVFLRYFIVRAGGQQVENIRAYLFRVLRNYLVDCRRKDYSGSFIALESARQVIDLRQDLESAYQQNEHFRQVLSELAPREQECIQLRLEGFGYEEIAQMLGIRSGTVSALLARALRKLRHSSLFQRSS